jgi:hypothetical protein
MQPSRLAPRPPRTGEMLRGLLWAVVCGASREKRLQVRRGGLVEDPARGSTHWGRESASGGSGTKAGGAARGAWRLPVLYGRGLTRALVAGLGRWTAQ